MANDALTLRINAQTDDFIKNVQAAQTKVRSLSQQMSEIDKQLKTETVDRVQKLSEKLELAERASKMAAKEAELYGDKLAKLTSKHDDASKLTDKQKESVIKLGEQMATAEQKSNTYAAEVEKLKKQIQDETAASGMAESATDSLGSEFLDSAKDADEYADSITETAEVQEESAGFAAQLGNSIKANVIADFIVKGVQGLANAFKTLASKIWEATKAVGQYLLDGIELAKNMEETRSKVKAVFGEEGQAIMEKWASNAAHDFHTTEQAALEAAAGYGNILTSMGMASNEAMNYSQKLILVAAAQADFNNMPTADVLEKIQSALAGNYKGLQSLGIVLNEEIITQKALEMHREKSKDTLTDLEKKEAALQLIIEKSSNAIEVYSENTGSLTSMQGELAAKLEDIHRKIGEQLYPIAEKLYDKILDFINTPEFEELLDSIYEGFSKIADKLIEWMESDQFQQWIDELIEKLPGLVEQIGSVFDTLTDLIPKIADLTDKLLALFGIKSEAQKTKDAFKEVKDSVEDLAKSYNISTETMSKAINEFAHQNGISSKEVLENWETYAPQIAEFLDGLAHGYEADFDSALGTIQQFAQDNGLTLSDVVDDWWMYEPQVEQYAASLGEDYQREFDNALGLIQDFARDNDLELSDVVSNWSYYEPQVQSWMETLGNDTRDMEETYAEHLGTLAPTTQEKINDVQYTNMGPLENLLWKIKSWAQDVKNWIKKGMDEVATAQVSWEDQPALNADFVQMEANGGTWTPRASGGPAKAGQMYRVNDAHGRQIETFIPSVNGYILDGNTTEKIINNSTNNNTSYGNVTVYVNSYGTDAASIADEIGNEISKKRRMAGSW